MCTAHAWNSRAVVGMQEKLVVPTIYPSGLRALQSKKRLRKTTQKVPLIGL